MGLAITSGTVVTLDPPRVERRDVACAGGAGAIDAGGCVVMPGLAIAHTHLYSGLARAMPPPPGPTRSFREILERVWWRLDRALDAASLRASAEAALLDAALCGATAVIDHHESPSFIDGSLEVIAGAARAVGVRALVCYGATDRHGEAGARAGLGECERAIAALTGDARVRGAVGLHAAFTCGDATLEAAADLARRTGAAVHVHAAEDRIDAGALARLDRAGLVGPRTVLAHGVHLAPADRARVAEAGATVVHNPRSNQQNAVGYADVRALAGRVALGTDGMDGDLWTEARAAHLSGRAAYGPDGGIDALALLAASQRLADDLLGPRPDDWIVLDYDPPAPLSDATVAGHVLFGMAARHVRDVIVAGEPIVRDRRPARVDAAEVAARGRAQAARLYERMRELPA